MAKVYKVEKSRKEVKCSKCGKTLPIGSPYVWGQRYMAKFKTIRCVSCGLKGYELSSSEWVQTIGELTENFAEAYGYDDDGIESAISTLEELRDNSQDSYDNIPEQFQYGEQGELLESRIDQCDDAISELESIDIDSCKDEAIGNVGTVTVSQKEYKEYYGDEANEDILSEVEEGEDEADIELELDITALPYGEDYDEIIELPFLSDYDKERIKEELSGIIESSVDDALSVLEY